MPFYNSSLSPRGIFGVIFVMEKYMLRAIELAKKGAGFVNPNPLVGAVIVKNGKIIGDGYHERYGGLHAERNALKNCKEDANGAQMYVTLEPCCHYGKNPPCTKAVIEAGIKRVYVGSYDPNPLVAGKGIAQLRDAGIEVVEGFLREKCDKLNDIFFHFITTKRPYVILKSAITLDGKIAAYTGHSKWITNELSREDTHRIRKRCAAIMTGIGTVLSDNPMLNCRCKNPSNPIRIICDSKLNIPLECEIVKTAAEIPTYIATSSENLEKIAKLKKKNVKTIKISSVKNGIDLTELMDRLGEMGIDSVLIEGGAKIHTSALAAGIVNRVQVYIAPKIIGDDGISAFSAMGINNVNDSVVLKNPQVHMFGDDIMIEYEVK